MLWGVFYVLFRRNMGNTLEDNKKFFYRRMWTVALPVVFQHFISISLNLADTVMIGRLGEIQLAASGAANQIFGVFFTICFGLLSGGSVFLAQYWGAGNIPKINKIQGFDFIAVFLLSLIFFSAIQLDGPGLMRIFVDNRQVIDYGNQYLKIVSWSYLIVGFSFTISFNSRAVQILKVPTIIAAVALGLNIFLNWCLIFGHLGMAAMGIRGAAVATLTARILELVLLILYVIIKKDHPFHVRFSEIFARDRQLYGKVFRMSLPVIISEGGWSIGMALVFATYGRIGAAALAVVQVSNVTSQIFQSAFFGLGSGAAVVIGETLGMGDREAAFEHSKRTVRIGAVFAAIMVILILLSIKPIGMIYNFKPETIVLLKKSLTVFAFAMVPKMLAYILQCGILRAGGDTLFCMVVELISNLGLELALAYVSVVVLGWSLPACLGLAAFGNVFKMTVMYVRYRSKKWINIVI